MKKKLFGISLLICLGSCNLVLAQQTKAKVKVKSKTEGLKTAPAKEKVYIAADQMPVFPGGEAALKDYFQRALLIHNFPSSGMVTLSLLIDKSGQPTDITVAAGMSPEIDAKVLETARKMPAWQPGQNDGKPVNVRLSLPVFVPKPAAASTEEADEKIYTSVGQQPNFPGGESRMYEFFASNMKYPAAAEANGLEGLVVVSFVVKKDGTIADPKILKSLGKELDGEALRLVSIMPVWTPGKQNGRPVNVQFTLPIRFKLTSQAESGK